MGPVFLIHMVRVESNKPCVAITSKVDITTSNSRLHNITTCCMLKRAGHFIQIGKYVPLKPRLCLSVHGVVTENGLYN